MSSSHLFLGLPIALLVLYFELSSGFLSAAFTNHLSLGDVAILSASLHSILVLSLVLTSNHRILHLFHGFVCASFHVFDPIFLFNICSVNFFLSIVLERHVAVLVFVSV